MCTRLATFLYLLATASSLALSLECQNYDSACLQRCKPGTIRRPVVRLIEKECPVQLQSRRICWQGKALKGPENLTASLITNTSAQLSWSAPADWPADAEVHFDCQLIGRSFLTKFKPRPSGVTGRADAGGALSVRVERLLPRQSYRCTVWADLGGTRSRSAVVRFGTKPGVPAFPVAELEFVYIASTSVILIKWNAGRPDCDQVAGYRLTFGHSEEILLTKDANSYEIVQAHWSRVLADPDSRLLNVTIAPVNGFGVGPESKTSLLLPPYDEYRTSKNGCSEVNQVYTFEQRRSDDSQQSAGPTKLPQVCFRKIVYMECTHND